VNVKLSTIAVGILHTAALSANNFTGRKSTNVSVVGSAEGWKYSERRCHRNKGWSKAVNSG
jgi:hypothetical protein